MSRQYDRVYELTIAGQDGQGRIITDLEIAFEVTKSVLSFPNLANIKLYNANQDTKALLQKKYTQVILNAGYRGNSRLLFKGEVRNVFQTRKGVDAILEIYAGDGERDWQNSSFNKTFTESVSIQRVVKEVLASFTELSVGALQGVPDIADKLRGRTLSGSSKDVMDQLADEYGFSWSIQDGEILVVPDEEPLEGTQAVLISAATGMIGSPTITEIGADVTTLLNPELLPNRGFVIESIAADVQLGNLFFRNVPRTTAEGFYKVQEVVFSGNTRNGEWVANVKGRRL